jgi:hypothetical protein
MALWRVKFLLAGARCARPVTGDVPARLHHLAGRFHHHQLRQGAGMETLPAAIFGSVKQGIKPNIMAISTLMLLVSVLFVSLSYLINRRGRSGAQFRE